MQPELIGTGRTKSLGALQNAFEPPGWGLHLTVIRHSLGWLAAANLIGLWLAANLVWPGLERLAGPLTYGRWMPLHTDWELYGWGALPLIGLLLRWMPPPDRRHAQVARAVIVLWSGVLAASGLSWLGGQVSGKLFLSATGVLRWGLPAVLALLWACLGANLWHNRRSLARAGLYARGLLLAGLLPVPAFLWRAGDPRNYPAFNPDSGGATGAALLGSTLVVVASVGLLPWALQIPANERRGPCRIFAGYLLFSVGVFVAIDHGNVSHHQPAAIAALATLLGWIPALSAYLNSFRWSTAPCWRQALVAWWTLLAITGFVVFLPGMSERLKFTNALVAHAHLAMAGFATALGFIILQAMAQGHLRAILEGRLAFGLWQTGAAIFVISMSVLGWRESEVPGVLFRADTLSAALYAIRLAAGVIMAGVSLWWYWLVAERGSVSGLSADGPRNAGGVPLRVSQKT